MCTRPKSEIWHAPPIFQIMPRFESGLGPVGDFIVMITGVSKRSLSQLIEFRHFIFAGYMSRAVAMAAFQQFAAQTALLVNFQDVNRDMFGCEIRQTRQ